MLNHSTLSKSVLICFCILCLFGCSKLRSKVEPKPHWFKYYSAFSNHDYQTYFLNRMENDSLFAQATYTKWFYGSNPTPVWTTNGLQEHRTQELMDYLSHSYEHGIPASFFDYDSICSQINKLKSHQVPNNDSLYYYLFMLEHSLTNAYVNYAEALCYGATDPKVVNGGKWLYEMAPRDTSLHKTLTDGVGDVDATLKELQPTDTNYVQLQHELLRLYPLKDTTWKTIPVRSVKAGQQSDIIPLICQRLRVTGELREDFPDTDRLTPEVLAGINTFRAANNIPVCDSLGKETIEKLNRPISYYVDKLSINMERLRWKTKAVKGENRIVVNLPDFTLQAFLHNERKVFTKICCGKTQNPANNPSRVRNGITRAFKAETPLLYSEIRRIVLNPEWNIPYDILKNEYYPKLCKSNTAVVNREKLYIKDTRTGKYVAPESIDWTKVNRNNIPYRMFQSSGRHNALGMVKFDFANTESVYLHDTNNKGAFKRRVRTFSHGCVRVENPFDLVDLLYEFNEFDEWELERLGMLVGQEPQTKKGEKYLEKMEEKENEYYEKLSDEEKPFYRKLRPSSVMLSHKMPLFIEYNTCFVGDDGIIQYREDMYYKDDNILHMMGIK